MLSVLLLLTCCFWHTIYPAATTEKPRSFRQLIRNADFKAILSRLDPNLDFKHITENFYTYSTPETSVFRPETYQFTSDDCLCVASYYRYNPELIKALLVCGANPNRTNNRNGITALMHASMNPYDDETVPTLTHLLDAKADLFAQDSRGRNALIYATIARNIPAVKKLLEAQLDNRCIIDAPDAYGLCAGNYAEKNEYAMNQLPEYPLGTQRGEETAARGQDINALFQESVTRYCSSLCDSLDSVKVVDPSRPDQQDNQSSTPPHQVRENQAPEECIVS